MSKCDRNTCCECVERLIISHNNYRHLVDAIQDYQRDGYELTHVWYEKRGWLFIRYKYSARLIYCGIDDENTACSLKFNIGPVERK